MKIFRLLTASITIFNNFRNVTTEPIIKWKSDLWQRRSKYIYQFGEERGRQRKVYVVMQIARTLAWPFIGTAKTSLWKRPLMEYLKEAIINKRTFTWFCCWLFRRRRHIDESMNSTSIIIRFDNIISSTFRNVLYRNMGFYQQFQCFLWQVFCCIDLFF